MAIVVSKRRPSGERRAKHKAAGYKCPYPGCGHGGAMITKAHCRIVHNMERDELFQKYGEPDILVTDPISLRENLKGHVPVYPRKDIGGYSSPRKDSL